MASKLQNHLEFVLMVYQDTLSEMKRRNLDKEELQLRAKDILKFHNELNDLIDGMPPVNLDKPEHRLDDLFN